MINIMTIGGNANTYVTMGILVAGLALLLAMTYFPNKKRRKQMDDMMNNLAVGDKVITIGRMVGNIVKVNEVDNTVVLNVGSEEAPVNVTFEKMAIGMVVQKKGEPVAPVEPVKEEKAEKKVVVAEKSAKALKVEEQIKESMKVDTEEKINEEEDK